MPDEERVASRRRQRLAELSIGRSIGGWIHYRHCDCIDDDGTQTSCEEWRHQDGREATEWPGGHCSDPELEALLRARDEANERRRAEVQRGMLLPRLRALVKSILKLWHFLRSARQ